MAIELPLRGRLEEVPFVFLLRELARSGESAAVRVLNPAGWRLLHVDGGEIVDGASSFSVDWLRHVASLTTVPRTEGVLFSSEAEELTEDGAIETSSGKVLITAALRLLAFRLMDTPTGEFRIRRGEFGRRSESRIAISSVLLVGLKEASRTWLLERLVPHSELVFERVEPALWAAPIEELEAAERELIAQIDGQATMADFCSDSGLEGGSVRRLLVGCWLSGLLSCPSEETAWQASLMVHAETDEDAAAALEPGEPRGEGTEKVEAILAADAVEEEEFDGATVPPVSPADVDLPTVEELRDHLTRSEFAELADRLLRGGGSPLVTQRCLAKVIEIQPSVAAHRAAMGDLYLRHGYRYAAEWHYRNALECDLRSEQARQGLLSLGVRVSESRLRGLFRRFGLGGDD